MSGAPIVPVPGFWLGAWAWDDVATALRADGYDVTALTLPGSEYDRLDIPSTAIYTGFSSEQVKDAVSKGYAWLGGFAELRNVTWVDLPTSHWPMWSRPRELAGVLSDVARAAVRGARDA